MNVTLEDVLNHEALDYKETMGASGPQLSIRCCANPSCGNERWDKVYANQDTGAGKCFKCGETFNTWTWVRWLLQGRGGAGSNRDVGAYLADLARKIGYRPKAEALKPKVATIEGDFELPASIPLPDERGQNHEYLEKRGIDGAHAAMFGLRFSYIGKHSYTNAAGDKIDQSFAQRVIFPVWNLDGVMVTFQGRDVTGLSETRYKFAGGLPGTGRYLYNGHTARGLHAKHVLLNEGPTDVIKSQIALELAPDLAHIVPVGSFGMKLSEAAEGADQLGAFKTLRREGLERVYIMWDGEEEAFNNALDAAQALIKAQLEVFICTLPQPTPAEKASGIKSHDPGSVDAHTIHQAIRNATPVTRLSMLKLKMSNPYKKR